MATRREAFPIQDGIKKISAWLAVLLVTGLNAWALRAELTISRLDLNDSVFHFTLIERMAQALEHGENPLDVWMSEWTFGYPVAHTYQPLGHLLIAAIHFLSGKTVSLMTLFVWARFLLVSLLPLSFFLSGRLMGLSRRTAVAAAVVAPLVSTNALYGVEYGSFLWRGSGLYPQLLATHLFLFTIGQGWRALRGQGKLSASALLLALTYSSHLIYGHMTLVTLALITLLPNARKSWTERLGRFFLTSAVAVALISFQIVPLLMDSPWINRSRWEAAWKWDSFGMNTVLSWFFKGDLLDFGRPAVVTLLVAFGAAWALWRQRKPEARAETDDSRESLLFVLAGTLLWLALFFGRPTWGNLYLLMGAGELTHLHRLIGGFHCFAIFLAAAGMVSIWHCLGRTGALDRLVAALALALLLMPAIRERRHFLEQNAQWGRENLTAYQNETSDLERVLAETRTAPGRVYPGLAAGWGGTFRVGHVPVHSFLSTNHVPAIAFLYHSMALPGDLMVRFNEAAPDQYRLFNISTVLAPETVVPPPFLKPLVQAGRFLLYSVDSGGYFDLVSAPYSSRVNRRNFYELNEAWLLSDWPAKKQHVLLQLDPSPVWQPKLRSGQPWPAVPAADSPGHVLSESREGETYSTEVAVQRECYLLFKMTYHPGWRALIDGSQTVPEMLSPGFIGVPLQPGHHRVVLTYEGGSAGPLILGVSGALLFVGLAWGESTSGRRLLKSRVKDLEVVLHWAGSKFRTRTWKAAGILLIIVVPLAAPLLTSSHLNGHDALEYVPRLVEFYKNLRQGIFLPRWAPDLSSGFGQPFFLFNPPLLYYVAEIFCAAGTGAVLAFNLTAVMVILCSAFSMFLLARYYFGQLGGILGAAAYVYAPYFHVDLYVRYALAEFFAFPFYPLVLYGLARYARERKRNFLLLAAVAYAAILGSHNPAALLFTPLLLSFIVFASWQERSWSVLAYQLGAWVLGLALAAAIWLPIFTEKDYVSVHRLLEGHLAYSNHFVLEKQLVLPMWGYGLSVAGDQDGMSFSIGWTHVVLLAAVVLTAGRLDRRSREFSLFLLAGILAYGLLMIPEARFIWDRLTLLQYVQFPWRMLAPMTFGVALSVSALGKFLQEGRKAILYGMVLAVLTLPNLAHAQPSGYFELDASEWTPAQLAQRGTAVTTREEYQPRWMEERPVFRQERFRAAAGRLEIFEEERTAVSWQGRLRAEKTDWVEASLAYFPGWSVRVDGQEVPAHPAEKTGLLRFQFPAGTHEVEVRFKRTLARSAAELTSAVTLAAILVFFLLWRKDRTGATRRRD
ncbi:MAG: YfhO family protein [Acidobacteria bacterium]|nr:YfhO family protein [Acidobacteriota bacterium]